ncbi:MAG: M36 family metallopeptidase [Thermoanaerobaculia bacterium]
MARSSHRVHSPCRFTVLFALAALLWSGATWAEGERSEPRNFDARSASSLVEKASADDLQKAAEDDLARSVPDLAVDYDPMTGVARSVRSHTGYLSEPGAGNALSIAQRFTREQRELLGLSTSDLAHFRTADEVYSEVGGATHVYLEQIHQGIPVYNGQLHVNVNRDGRVMSVHNAFVPNLATVAPADSPSRSPQEALLAVADHLGLELGDARLLDAAADAQRTTRLSGGGVSLSDVETRLYWLPVGARDVRLVWNLQVETPDGRHWYDINVDADSGDVWTRFDWITSGTYRVVKEPDESPLHGTMGRQLVIDPENATASPSGWFTGGTMAGNNVHACPDTDANNACDSDPQCSGTTCDFPLDLSQAPSTYIPAATANLFYWNNLIHDTQYIYGFDEAAGNFQENNFGLGGVGSDSVNADAQDGSGNCNANFATPADGGNPRMQMFTCTNATPARDGDFDNGVIIHEYGHGISNRQVGGPGNVSCLNNTQQAGEGWSDWLGLAYTSEPGDAGTDARGIGSYLFNEPPEGGGIRDLPYSTDPAVNNWTYESISGAAVPHGVGSRWAQAIWEVYWALVGAHGIEFDLQNFDINDANEAGNKRAMFYINEGLKNTACSPTFVDNRDGIIQAATDNFGGADVCLLWDTFAAFGLGTDAVSGGPSSTSPTNGFDTPLPCQCQPSPIADAGPDQLICLGDSTTVGTPAQPDNTYSWAPGGETTAQITVSPAVDTTYTVTATTAACGSDADSATVFIDPDGTRAGLSDDFEGAVAGWSATGLWHLADNTACATPGSNSPTHAFYYGQEATCTYDTGAANSGTLTSPVILGLDATASLEFQYYRVVESFAGTFDVTTVDVVTAGGRTTVFQLTSADLSTAAWVSSGAIDLSAFAGQAITLEFSFNTGDGVANNFTGWLIDDVVVSTTPLDCGGGCTSDLDCDNGLFCDGAETCNVGTGACQAGTAVDCGDGVGCTDDVCDEATDSCDNVANDANCDNGLFCDGAETCDPVLDCQTGTAPDCDDGVACTVDSCDEGAGACDNAPNDPLCDNGLFCDGVEACDPVLGCLAGGGDPCAAGETCDEDGDICVGTCGQKRDPCVVDEDCCSNKCRGPAGGKSCK